MSAELLQRAWHLACRSAAAAGVVLRRGVLHLLLAPGKWSAFMRRMGHQILAYDHEESEGRLPCRALAEAVPGIQDTEVALADVFPKDGNLSAVELYAICALAKHRGAGSVLEIGTFDGLLMANLVRNTPASAKLITLDLPPEQLPALSRPLAPGESVYVEKACIGERLKRLSPENRRRVTQLYGDSMRMDWKPYYGQMDLVFVDASHAYAYVKHDSEEALRLRSERGIVLWHDYLAWPDVTRCLNELGRTLPLVRIAGTSLVAFGL